MKKLLLGLCLSLGMATAFASFQYDAGAISSAKADVGNSQYAAVVNRGGWGGSLQNSMVFNTSTYITASFSKNMPSAFGVYTLSGNQVTGSYTLAQIGNTGIYTAVDANGNAVKFGAGDEVGFWLKDEQDKYVLNTPGVAGSHSQNYVGTEIKNKNEYIIGFGNHGSYVNSDENMFDNSAFVMNVQTGSKAPLGQPLPGVLATLLLGGSILGGASLKRKAAGKRLAA